MRTTINVPEEIKSTYSEVQTVEKTKRNSNFELMRIVCIFFIMGYHYLYHSGLLGKIDFNNITPNMLFLQFFCFGGKMAINSFVLLSAYYLCKSKTVITWKRVLKLYLEVIFYSISVFALLTITGVSDFSLRECYNALVKPFNQIGWAFAGSFLFFYILIPVLNRFLSVLNKETHRALIFYLLLVYSILTTIPIVKVPGPGGYLGWFIALYLVASYIRLYPANWMNNKKYAICLFCASLLVQWLWVIVVDFIGGGRFDMSKSFHLCVDSYKIIAFTMSLSLFLFFKNINIKHNRFINTLAASTFGVYLIHSPSKLMRSFLWGDVFHTTDFYDTVWLPAHMIGSLILVYVVCVTIDYLRIKYIETPLFEKIGKVEWLNKECLLK